jgi:hypothetical protein
LDVEAGLARREERAYRVYVSDEQRGEGGCIGGQTDTFILVRVLSAGHPVVVSEWTPPELVKAATKAGTQKNAFAFDEVLDRFTRILHP